MIFYFECLKWVFKIGYLYYKFFGLMEFELL